MKLKKKEPKKEQTIASFSDTKPKPDPCGDAAGYGLNPTGEDNAAANYIYNNK